MNTKYSPLLTLSVSACLSALVTHTAYASDIETLVGQVQDFAGPNVTLVVDTSGSMVSQVFIGSEADPYDATFDYTGPFDIYESFGVPRRLLYSLTPSSSINYLDEDDLDTNQWVEPTAFACANGQTQLTSSGLYSDRFAQFRIDGDTAFWGFPVPAGGTGGESNITECMADFGIHGDGSGAGTYPVNFEILPTPISTLHPWSTSETDPQVVNWQNTGAGYTFFTPNYLNWIYERKIADEPVVLSRLEIVQNVANELVQTLKARSVLNNDGLRLGLMRFSANGAGGMVVAPTVKLATGDHDVTLKSEIDALTPTGSTPLAETMYEAYRYYKGDAPRFGDASTPTTSVATSLDGGNYRSPIEAACQKNYVVLLTDGNPNLDFEADNDIENLTGPCDGDNCLDDLTNYMKTTDLATGSGFSGNQSIDTFIIGFFADFPLLQDATTGQVDTNDDGEPDTPGYFLANNPDQLKEAFDDIFDSVDTDVASFTAPAVSVNSLNRFTNRDTLYFTLYKPSPSGQPHWDGNLKGYKIGRATEGGDIEILDANGAPAVDPSTGLFNTRAVSLWGTDSDGPDVSEGGVAARLSAQRNIFSNLTSNATLSVEGNVISRDNSDVIGAIPGMPQGDELLELIDYTSGLDEEGGARRMLGDPLHSQPLVINFDGGTDDLLLVFGTNDGFIHAIDPTQENTTTNDMEYFAFIPKKLLPRQVDLKANRPSANRIDSKIYGMDGPITAWIEGDDDKNFIVESGDNLWVYAGMRRGGRGYYAFDMTNRNAPELKFVIDNTRTNFSNLGQTWSSASYAKINLNDIEKDVLIFGGGYDPNQDRDNNSADTMGNSVYIVDARTGNLIWSAGGPGTGANLELDAMTHSIPSDVRIIDTNGDGFINRLYVGDMAAQVWRFDINTNPVRTDLAITGGRIADFGGEGTANERRFYSAPSVSRYVEDGRGFLTIALGSGYRASPLDVKIDDKLYVIRDDFIYAPSVDPATNIPEYENAERNPLVTETEMLELTLNGIQSGTPTITAGDFGRGWYLGLDASSGEKSLSSAVTAEGRIFFTTYSPDSPALSCDPVAATGLGRFYGIDILSGQPALYDDVAGVPPIAASVELGATGIPPQPKLIFVTPECDDCASDDGLVPNIAELVVQAGTETIDVGLATRPVRTYWVEL